jgi:hypothetical protein
MREVALLCVLLLVVNAASVGLVTLIAMSIGLN